MKKKMFYFLLPAMILFILGCEKNLTDSEIVMDAGYLNHSEIVSEDLGLRAANNGQSNTVISPFNISLWNDCTEEMVDLEGNFRTMVHVNIDGNGIPHVNSKTGFMNTSGVGQSSGLKYRWVGSGEECNAPQCIGDRIVNIHCNPVLCPDGVVVFTGLVRQRLISQGNAEDIVVSAFFHITLNANGDIPVVNQDFLNIECH